MCNGVAGINAYCLFIHSGIMKIMQPNRNSTLAIMLMASPARSDPQRKKRAQIVKINHPEKLNIQTVRSFICVVLPI